MARDRGEFMPQQQVLIYPAVNNDYSEASPFPSVMENGSDFFSHGRSCASTWITTKAAKMIGRIPILPPYWSRTYPGSPGH